MRPNFASSCERIYGTPCRLSPRAGSVASRGRGARFMPNYRTLALAVIMTGAFAASAASQDCDRYAYGCRGAPGYAQPQPGYAQPVPPQPQPRYAPRYSGYPAYQRDQIGRAHA